VVSAVGDSSNFLQAKGRAMETLINLIIDVWIAPIVD